VKNAIRLLGVFLGGISLLCFWETYRIWNGWAGPGSVPLIVSILLAINSISFLIVSSKEATQFTWPSNKSAARICGIAGLFAFYIIIVQWLGYLISTWFFMAAVSRVVAPDRFKLYVLIIWTGLVSLCLYIIFIDLLSVHLPSGILWG
jgi:hypothetical protein